MKMKILIKKMMPQFMWEWLRNCKGKYDEKKMLRKNQILDKFDKGTYPYGVNLMGDIRAETGLGQSMRMVARLLELGKVPFLVRQIDVPGDMAHMERCWDKVIEEENRYGINLIHINNSIWQQSYNQIPVSDLNRRYNIAYWLWELENFPDEWLPCIETVDEIWTPAEFISAGIRKKTDKPVMTMPYGMELDMKELLEREYFRLPQDKFLFLVMYDFLSISERKNPQGVIKAYKKAFSTENQNVGLVIKVNHLGNKGELENLKKELEGYPNIYFITDNLSRKEVESLIAVVDVLVSLHRAEGFGLPLAEAMYLGTPVIATNWSAPTEFMDEKSACLVDYELITLSADIGPYHKGNRWADANIDQTAEYMKKLSEDKAYYENKIRAGSTYIREVLNPEKMAQKMENRIREIYGM